MIKRLKILLVAVAVVLLWSFALYAAEEIVAKVSGVPITAAEVQRELNKLMPFKVGFHSKIPKEKIENIKAEALETLIERGHKIAYAIENNITVPDEQVDDALEKVKARFKTAEEFEAAVGNESVAGLRAAIFRQLIAQKAETVAVESKIQVSDEEVESFYEGNKQSYKMPLQFRASHVLIKVDPSSSAEQRTELKAKAEGLLQRAKSGEDFYNLAYYNSDDRTKYVGGDLGLFHEGRTAKPFEDALKQMEIGEISDLVKTRWGYHIIKLTEKNESRQIPFEEMKGKLRGQLEKEQRDMYYQQWFDSLQEKYVVEHLGE